MEINTEKIDNNLLREIPLYGIDQGVYLIKVTVDQRDISYTRLVITR
jgi:hypothetical protein